MVRVRFTVSLLNDSIVRRTLHDFYSPYFSPELMVKFNKNIRLKIKHFYCREERAILAVGIVLHRTYLFGIDSMQVLKLFVVHSQGR